MPKLVYLLILLAMLVGTNSAPSVLAAPPEPSQVDLRALEQQILVEVNKIRTNPQEFANILVSMKQNAKTTTYGFQMTLPDSTLTTAKSPWLDGNMGAIAEAQRLKPMQPVLWSDGIAQVARKYANKNPKGHNDFGTTVMSRMNEFGVSNGMAESINYSGATGMNQTYILFIDSGVTSLGHRKMMIDPKYTHLGIGCFYPNNYQNITCVLNYAKDWVDKIDTIKPEVGKQYALLGENNTFRYAKLVSTTGKQPFPFRFEICPTPMAGGMSMPDTGRVTTVETAASKNLVAQNEPCDVATAPRGVLNNGTSLPGAQAAPTPAAAAPTQAPPTQAPATQVPPTQVPPTQAPATAAPVRPTQVPPTQAPATQVPPTQVPPTQVPPAQPPAGSGNTSAPLELQIDKQYALREANNTFRYAKLTHYYGNTAGYRYFFDACPNPAQRGTITIYDTLMVTSVARAQTEGLTPTNEPCSDSVAPPYVGGANIIKRIAPLKYEVGKQYVVRQSDGTYGYYKLETLSTNSGGAPAYRAGLCPSPSRTNQIAITNLTNMITVAEALEVNITMTNQPCDTSTVPHGK